MAHKDPILVQPSWLADRLNGSDSSGSSDAIRVLDASWYLPSMGRDAMAEFQASRIPGSLRFDIDAVAREHKGLPHMLPEPRVFAAAADAAGVAADTLVVVYDRMGTFSSPRAWWTWRMFGHERVAVLDGGMPAWEAAGCPVDTEPATEQAARGIADAARAAMQEPQHCKPTYVAALNSRAVRSLEEVQAVSAGSAAGQLVDARSADRFLGQAPEPRADIPSGHMPGALNVPFTSLLVGDKPTGGFKPPAELRQAFEQAGVDLQQPITCTCGSGATAAVLAHALAQLGIAECSLYDGSWMEWATTEGNKIVDSS